MKKVLVTGAFGFIGSNMVKFLLDNTDYHIVGVDDGSGATNTQLMIDLQKENVGRISLAFMDFTEVSLYDIDVVYHFAATPRVSYSVEEPIETNDNNVTKTLLLLERCGKANVKRFVFSSSSSIYGDVETFPTKETEEKNPKSPYALQKFIIEEYCKLWSELYGLDTVCLRYFNVYGPNQYAENSYATVICAWIKGYLSNEPIRLDGDGTQSRDFTYVTDICNANYIIGKYEGNLNGKCFNAAGGNNYSLLDVKDKIDILSDNNPELIIKPTRVGDVYKTKSDSSELGKFGLKTEVDLAEGIKRTYEWYKSNLVNG